MGAMVPRNDGDGRRVLHELARLRAWLGQGGSAEECARDLIKDSLVHSRARGDWATYLMGIYPKAGKRASEDLTWCHGLRLPARVEQQGPWLEAVGKILAARTVVDDAEHSGDWQHKELSVLTALWRATEQTWIANDTQMTQIERLVRENAKPEDLGCAEFVAWQRQQQLGRIAAGAGDKAEPDRKTTGPRM